MARGPTGSRVVTGVSARPVSLSTRAMLTVSSCATRRGSLSGASMVAKVSPGTPATANSPDTRSGCRKASSNIVLTPIDQPMSGARSMPKWSITESASSTNASMPQWAGSAGRSEPPVPRWFHEMIRTPQSGRSSAGQVHGPVPSPLQSTTVGPSMRPVRVVGPRGQAGAVVGQHVVVGDARRRRDPRRRGRHGSILPERRRSVPAGGCSACRLAARRRSGAAAPAARAAAPRSRRRRPGARRGGRRARCWRPSRCGGRPAATRRSRRGPGRARRTVRRTGG